MEPDYYPDSSEVYPPCITYPLINSSLISNTNLTSWLLSSDLFTKWTPLHHVYYQLANCTILLFFLLNCLRNSVISKIFGLFYSLFNLLWGYFVIKSLDCVFYNTLVFFVCALGILYRIVSFLFAFCDAGFGRDVEQVYRKLFEPLQVTRRQFSRVLSCKRTTSTLHHGENYAVEKSTRVDSLSLLLNGKLLVSQQGRPLHIILPHQFVDSPEYFGVSTDELFQVTITAVEDSKLLVWHRDKLRLTIMSDEFLRVMFDHVIGRDVVRKLIQVSDSVSITNGYYLPTAATSKDVHSNDSSFCPEDEPMLEKNEDSQFESTEIWSLTKIAEEETPV